MYKIKLLVYRIVYAASKVKHHQTISIEKIVARNFKDSHSYIYQIACRDLSVDK